MLRSLRAAVGLLTLLGSAFAGPEAATGQSDPERPRPRPYPPFVSPAFARAVKRGTRTPSGQPGPRYWQQHATYRLSARLDPTTRRLTGEGTVRYQNNSPDTLRTAWFHLRQNLFAPATVRNQVVPLTGGMELGRVMAQGRELSAVTADTSIGYQVFATLLRIRLPEPLPSTAIAEFRFDWAFNVAPDGAPRGGQDGEVFFISYWYPQVAVYDDLSGWQADPYMGNAEFHMGFADYEVALTVPAGWLIGATGRHQNPAEVLSAKTLDRLRRVPTAKEVVHVVPETERGAGSATLPGAEGWLTWRFSAEQVRDFAFGASAQYLWDATSAQVGDLDGDRVAERAVVHTLYRPSRRAWAWDQSARYAQHSIEFLSRLLWPYPWPHATAVDGVSSCGGMEYPMITCIGGRRDTLTLYSVTVHELAHMWFPMQVASDEQRHAWQDEGLTRFNQAQAMREFFRGYDREAISRENYLELARAGGEVELMRHGDLYPFDSPAYGIASYDKMATNLSSLRGLIGERRFLAGYRTYGERWRGKHPSPWDFFYTFNEAAGQDLWWFWRTWWFETWTLDQAVADVRTERDSVVIVLEDRGLAPMPVRLAVQRADRGAQRLEIPVDVWLAGERRYELKLSASPAILSVEIDPERLFPDVDRGNNLWSGLGQGRERREERDRREGGGAMDQAQQDRRIDYIEVPVTDVAAAKRFYQQAFGWEFTDYGPDYTSFADGRLTGGLRKEVTHPGNGVLVVIYAVDLEGTRARVETAGGKISREPFDFPGGRRFHFTDPSGNELAVWTDQ